MFEHFPEAKTNFTKILTGGGGGLINLALGANGVATPPVTIDTFERIMSVQQKGEAIKLARESLPQLLGVGKRMADAFERMERRLPSEPAGAPGREPRRLEGTCGACKELFWYREGAKFLQCSRCLAVQKPDGTLVSVQEPSGGKPGAAAAEAPGPVPSPSLAGASAPASAPAPAPAPAPVPGEPVVLTPRGAIDVPMPEQRALVRI
jgi:LSD1 subclass zinc finger protein